MSAYQTKQLFDGRPATVTDQVVIVMTRHDDKPGVCVRAGQVVAISSTTDRPYICDLATNVTDWSAPMWTFRPTRTVDEIEALPPGSWTWRLSAIDAPREVGRRSVQDTSGPESDCG